MGLRVRALRPYARLTALQDAADITGLALPWQQLLIDGDVVLVLNDRVAAVRLLGAFHHLPI